MKHATKTASAVALLFIVAGCAQSAPTPVTYTPGYNPNAGPAPLAAAPSGRVSSGQLPPPPPPPPAGSDGQNGDMTNQSADNSTAGSDGMNDGSGNPGDNTQVASLGNSGSSGGSGGGTLSRSSVLGAYKVTTTGGNCQIILSLTKWTGGYRAASRGCPGAVADVSAWDVSGNQVVLKDGGGSNVANLSSSGGSRYEGQTTGGQQITLYR